MVQTEQFKINIILTSPAVYQVSLQFFGLNFRPKNNVNNCFKYMLNINISSTSGMHNFLLPFIIFQCVKIFQSKNWNNLGLPADAFWPKTTTLLKFSLLIYLCQWENKRAGALDTKKQIQLVFN